MPRGPFGLEDWRCEGRETCENRAMAIVVIGGHSRSVGKTSVVAGLIAALPEFNWTALKITQFGHGICSADGKPCDCDTGDDHFRALSDRSEERRVGKECRSRWSTYD